MDGLPLNGIGQVNHIPQESVKASTHLDLPVRGEPLMSVTRGQYVRHQNTVTFPVARYHRPLAGTKLYCLVTETHVC